MTWRRLLELAAVAAVALTSLELVVRGNVEMTYVENAAMFYRIVALTIAGVGLLALGAGLLGSLLHRLVGLSRDQATIAGALAPLVPTVLYLGGVDVPWDQDPYRLWFLVLTPVAFVGFSWAFRIPLSNREESLVSLWPAAAPLACWTRAVQMLHQGHAFFHDSVAALAVAWILGAAAVLFVIRRTPAAGSIFSAGLLVFAVAAGLVVPAGIDLNRPDDGVSSLDPAAPPIILLTVDTLRRDALSLYGAQTPTPAIDSLAAGAVVFDRAYSTAPWTQVSFASIHSGLTPWAHGVRRVTDRVPLLASALAPKLRDYGYNTAAIGRNDLLTAPGSAQAISEVFSDRIFFPRVVSPHTQAQSLLNSLAPSALQAHVTTPQLGEYASEWVRNHDQTPFFLWLHFYDPHDPYDLVPEFPPAFEPSPQLRRLTGRALDRASDGPSRLPGFREWSRALYQSEVQSVDAAIGRFLETLRAEGLYDRALIIFASDHGEEFAEHNGYGHGQSLYNELVRVPLVVKPPHGVANRRLEQPVSTVAIAPTIFDLASAPYDDKMYSAQSLRRAWQEPASAEAAAPVFMTGTNQGEAAEAVVWGNYKLVRWTDIGRDELFEFDSDPGDQDNLALRLPEQVAIGKALLADHALKEAKLAQARGFAGLSQEPLTPDEKRILRGLGYLQ